ncbi:MAG: response regulator transcription factor [Lachnospiraceae bacterium]|nr:response regulator transcription factor [Lachnospiraceae bacterium]MDE7358094.1 response regulator transcription factor [Lachnospiraceae bacterium]
MSSKYKILVIEDEKNIRHLISALLEADGYQTVPARDFSNGKMLYFSHRPDLVILDLGLPDGDGTDLLREIRKDSLIPVIVLSARMDESDKVEALDLGANDYVTKPFSSAELMARVRSVLRTAALHTGTGLSPGGVFTLDDLTIDYGARKVFIGQSEIRLTHTEYDILSYLSRCSGKVVTYSAIIKEIWGYSDSGSIKKLQVNMANIRKKLGAKPGKKNYIENELGIGYRM